MERLQKIISHAGIASRRAAEQMIVDGRVKVDGVVVRELGIQADPDVNVIEVDGKKIERAESPVYFLLYKPKGYVTTAKDERGRKTVLDLVSDVKERIYPVGRLDYGTEGALLMTNDGALTNAMLHPKSEVHKTYLARVDGFVSLAEVQKLRHGVELEDGMTSPARVKIVERDEKNDVTKLELTIHEGRNRQVRRMCEAVGHPVINLKRTEFAGLNLSGLKRGEYRPLTDSEIDYLYELGNLPQRSASPSADKEKSKK